MHREQLSFSSYLPSLKQEWKQVMIITDFVGNLKLNALFLSSYLPSLKQEWKQVMIISDFVGNLKLNALLLWYHCFRGCSIFGEQIGIGHGEDSTSEQDGVYAMLNLNLEFTLIPPISAITSLKTR